MVSGSSPARTATAWPTFGVRTANVRILSQIKKLARNLLETFPQGEMLVEAYRRDQRVRKARRYLEFGGIYPADREAILQDFRAVCINTQLTPAGICNLESVAREIIARSVEGAFVECGTWRGGSLGFWARTFVRNGGHPARCPIFGFDSFQGMPQMTKEDGESTAHWLHGKSMSNLSPAQLSGALEPAGINLATEQDVWSMVEGSGFPRERVTITKGWSVTITNLGNGKFSGLITKPRGGPPSDFRLCARIFTSGFSLVSPDAGKPCCRADARFSAVVCAYAIWHSQKRCGPIPRDFSVRQPLKTLRRGLPYRHWHSG